MSSPVYHYCSYWRTWSRVLMVQGGLFVELNLTPIPCCHSSTWEHDVKPEVIRVHFTQRSRGDFSTNRVPVAIIAQMEENLGEALTNRLLTHDYLSAVTFDQMRTADRLNTVGGGTPLAKIKEVPA